MPIERLNKIFCDILNKPDLIIDLQFSQKNVAEWDSLNHLNLIIAIEKEFKFRFTTKQIIDSKSVKHLLEIIEFNTSKS